MQELLLLDVHGIREQVGSSRAGTFMVATLTARARAHFQMCPVVREEANWPGVRGSVVTSTVVELIMVRGEVVQLPAHWTVMHQYPR